MATLRDAKRSDAMAVADIFNYYVLNTSVSLELTPFAPEDMAERIVNVQAEGYPFVVLEDEGKIVGFYFLTRWNYRKGFRSTAEMVIYVRKNMRGKGLAAQMMEHMFDIVKDKNYHMLVASVTMPSDGSIGVLKKYGFSKAAELPQFGRKFDEWKNIELWIKQLD